MAGGRSEEGEDFDFGSADEAELAALTTAVESSIFATAPKDSRNSTDRPVPSTFGTESSTQTHKQTRGIKRKNSVNDDEPALKRIGNPHSLTPPVWNELLDSKGLVIGKYHIVGSAKDDALGSKEPPLQRYSPESQIEDEATDRNSLPTHAHPFTCPLAVAALKKNFGFKGFRLKQEQAIARILNGGSAVVVFPTGGGKSLCYQVPALVFSELDSLDNSRSECDGGITLVVSPLIALMKDQVDSLVRRGIKAAVLDSTKTREEYLATVDELKEGGLKLLYCAPERLNNEGFVEHMKTVRGGIRLVAVDEAHCISEWGHAFRPDYLKVSRFVKEINAERVVCLTATATPRVAQDICEAFDIDQSGLFRTSSYRSNLLLLAEAGSTKQALYPKLCAFLRRHPGPSIIYVTLQKQTEALAENLRAQRFNAKPFHAGMQPAEKTAIQNEFMARNDLIIVATIAFGMGIDKSNIRTVIHFNIPNSLESYSQEIGRAGRDGQISHCLFYVCAEDLHLREMFARSDLPSRESLQGLLKGIFDMNANLAVGGQFEASHYEQEKEFDIRGTTLNNIYAHLELKSGLIRAITPIYTKYSFLPGHFYRRTLEVDNSPAATAIRIHATTKAKYTYIDVQAASLAQGISRADVVRKLNEWNDAEIIELKAAGVVHVYRVLKRLPRTPAEIEVVVKDLYSQMEAREKQALDRTEQMLNLVQSRDCFSKLLARHFGDDIPGGRSECGHCTWCQTHKPVVLETLPERPFNMSTFNAILSKVPYRDDARFLTRVAFGISSPRVTALKLSKDPLFGAMADHDFMTLLRAFTNKCSIDNQAGGPRVLAQPPIRADKAPVKRSKKSGRSYQR